MRSAPKAGADASAHEAAKKKTGSDFCSADRELASSPEEWIPLGHAASAAVERLAAKREQCEVNRILGEWVIHLRSRIGDRWHVFESRDCSIKADDLVIEIERLRLAITLAARGRR